MENTFTILLIVSITFLAIAIFQIIKTQDENKKLIGRYNKTVIEIKRLEEVNKMKDKVFAQISHDLRLPISSLTNSLSLYNEEKQSKLLDDTLFSLSNIQLTLNNLLKWASIQIKNAEPVFSLVHTSVLLDSVLKQLESQISAKSLKVLRLYTQDYQVKTDEHYLQIAVSNLLSNAIKYTPIGGAIKVNIYKSSNDVCISIRDSGEGIPNENLDKIFNYSISKIGTAGERGTGLGLSLTKEVVKKISGRITVESRIGVGSEFTIFLPK
jgi:two-component system sensor histidine kinase/response regulator